LAEPTIEETDVTLKIFGAVGLLFTLVLPARAVITIDTQLIRTGFSSHALADQERVLVYVRAPDRYSDLALPLEQQGLAAGAELTAA
jgi:hypothetical protein